MLSGHGNIGQMLVELDPETTDIEERKSQLVRLFEDRTADFVREIQPLVVGGVRTGEEEIRRLVDLLETPEPVLSDNESLERAVLSVLGDAAIPDPERDGVYRIEVPWAYRGDGVAAVYPAVTFRRSVAVRYRADEVEYITPLHPLVKALAADARRRLLQVYPNVRGLPPRRLAARMVPPNEPASVVFTYFVSLRGGGGLLEERLLPVRVGLDGEILGSPEENARWLEEGDGGDVPQEVLEHLFADRFAALMRVAEREAQRWAETRARELWELRRKQAEFLRRDLEVDVADRLREIEEEELQARGGIEETGQLLLFGAEPRGRSSFEARRAAVEAYKEQRLREIAEFERVDDPPAPKPLGALFLVPEEGTP